MSQSSSLQMGARAHGMGNASACLADVWSITNNIAGLAKVKTSTIGMSYHAIPSFKYFNRMAVSFAMPMRLGTTGASVFRFGDDLYNEQILSIGFANTFGLASLGIKANYIQYRAQGLETLTAYTLSFGGLATLTSQLFFGAHIININQPLINELTGERIPTRLLAGIMLQLSERFVAAAEIEKDLQAAPTLKAGFEYQPSKKAIFRSGFNLHPQSGFFGLGAKLKKLSLDYSLQVNHPLGLSHQATINVSPNVR